MSIGGKVSGTPNERDAQTHHLLLADALNPQPKKADECAPRYQWGNRKAAVQFLAKNDPGNTGESRAS